jgi:galactoside O-acetyltransferase
MPEPGRPRRRVMTPRPARRALALALLRSRVLKYRILSDCHNLYGNPRLVQPTFFSGAGTIAIGSDVTFGWPMGPDLLTGYGYFEARRPEATIEIGDDVFFGNTACVVCERTRISFGDGAMVGMFTYILDSDGHAFDDPANRMNSPGKAAPVEIGEHAFVAPHTMIFKGVTIGRNSVIGTGSVVTSSIPEGVIAVGNPARVIKTIDEVTPEERRVLAGEQV